MECCVSNIPGMIHTEKNESEFGISPTDFRIWRCFSGNKKKNKSDDEPNL